MTRDELEDRVAVLERLVLSLIQHMGKDGMLTDDLRSEIVDSLIEGATGNKGEEFHADLLRQAIEGGSSVSAGEGVAALQRRWRRQADAYGGKVPEID
ncbi:hypothetical protein [Methylobacterium nodulans]|uniref:Uncharacterized protein n=1 Tax=Methylobacterium nodulans (strain LMG 21967 / CNCM I-2342 / ORS 2060) TaxID=460265 RepID=B8ICQ5_METNO|nr:hypothetical protein [Methylobacterium nodulans]ACL57466.1 hypothetical protein Mnod_2496 [Methylobacterium nodulans ORS 2060]